MRLTRIPVAFSPDQQRPICPRCWSRPDLNWGKGRGLGEREMRGWSVSSAEPVEVAGERLPAVVAVHRCANPDCLTALSVTTLLGGGYVPAFVDERRLREDEAQRFALGRHDRAGIWRDAAGEPRTTPSQRDLFG